jgi:hypothetical protein
MVLPFSCAETVPATTIPACCNSTTALPCCFSHRPQQDATASLLLHTAAFCSHLSLGPASSLAPISPSSSCPRCPGLRVSVLSHNVLVPPNHTSAIAALPRASRIGFRVLGVQGFRATTAGVNNRMRAYPTAAE